MINKINASITPNRSNYYNSNISFKSLNTASENIDIYSKKFNSSISSMSGDIDIDKSKISGKVSNMSGTIYVYSSDVDGDVSNLSGKIKIKDNSTVKGNVSNSKGTIEFYQSSVTGNVLNEDGKMLLKDSVVDGSITVKPENLNLIGKNKIKELVLKGFKKAFEADAEKIKADLAKQGIIIGNIVHIDNTPGTVVNVFCGGELKSSKIVGNDKPLEFRLPKGNLIDIIRFDADKQGVLIIEKGTEFLGKVINGVIRRI